MSDYYTTEFTKSKSHIKPKYDTHFFGVSITKPQHFFQQHKEDCPEILNLGNKHIRHINLIHEPHFLDSGTLVIIQKQGQHRTLGVISTATNNNFTVDLIATQRFDSTIEALVNLSEEDLTYYDELNSHTYNIHRGYISTVSELEIGNNCAIVSDEYLCKLFKDHVGSTLLTI